jgi:hypothetical protein
MIKKFIQFLLLSAFVVSATYLLTTGWVDGELKKMPAAVGFIRQLNEKEQWQMFLYEEVLRQGLTFRDFRILKEIINCESSWRQFWKNGEVIIAGGNVGCEEHQKLRKFGEWIDIPAFIKMMIENGIVEVELIHQECPKCQPSLIIK